MSEGECCTTKGDWRDAALDEAKVEIRVQFKDVTEGIFTDISRNELVVRIQPSEAMYLKLNTKTPGYAFHVMPTEMDLTYKMRFTDTKIPEAYEVLILDALKGDHSNFVRDDELDVAWKVSAARWGCGCADAGRFSRRSCIGSMGRRARPPSRCPTPTGHVGRRSWTSLWRGTGTDGLRVTGEPPARERVRMLT